MITEKRLKLDLKISAVSLFYILVPQNCPLLELTVNAGNTSVSLIEICFHY